MKSRKTGSYLIAFKAVLLGLITTQIIATAHVYFSNRAFYQSLHLVRKAGYLLVPNQHVIESLQKMMPAFAGGLFFTLSIGSGLSIIAIILAWTWHRLLSRNKLALLIIISAWLMGIAGVNSNGFNSIATAYIAIIPLVVFTAVLYLLPDREEKRNRMITLLFFAAPVLLIAIWLPLAKGQVFLDIRDNILLTNSLGKKINDFYYNNTLYAAQAFKSLDQKTIKTCRLELIADDSHKTTIKNIFLSYDYLVIEGDHPVDLSVEEQDGNLLFSHLGKSILTTTLEKFSANPGTVLKDFSGRTDYSAPLRFYVFVSMMIGSPICLYIVLHGIFSLCLSLLVGRAWAVIMSVILCALIGTGIAIPLHMEKKLNIETGNLDQVLGSRLWRERVAALRYMTIKGPDNNKLAENYQNWLASPYIAERYWYVRALGANRSTAAGKALMTALDDPNTNVVCMAYYSLGRSGNTNVIDELKKRILSSNKWYEQFYAYRAIRTLGWQQSKTP